MSKTKTRTTRPIKPPVDQPSIADIRTALSHEIASWDHSYREIDGKIRNRDALHAIACLQAARRIVVKYG